jgi:hypothetical protein
MSHFTITKSGPNWNTYVVCALPGWCWTPDGPRRDGTDPRNSGPEWSDRVDRAHQFKTHRAAARIASQCAPSVRIVEHC